MKNIIAVFTCIILVLFLSNCSLHKRFEIPAPTGDTITIPEGTALISFVDQQGKTHTVLPDGKRLEPCELCPPNKTKECAESTTGRFCKGLVNATVVSVSSITRILSEFNPFCWTEIEGGKARQRCVCFPGEKNAVCQ